MTWTFWLIPQAVTFYQVTGKLSTFLPRSVGSSASTYKIGKLVRRSQVTNTSFTHNSLVFPSSFPLSFSIPTIFLLLLVKV
jgi:hypothetical protein